jgi:ATP-dependent DNA ligase
MAPTLVREPFHRDGWVFEEKVDGWRLLAYKDGARVRLVSRNGRDHTRRFAGIAAAVAKLAARALVLDGEVAIFDEQLCGGSGSRSFSLSACFLCRSRSSTAGPYSQSRMACSCGVAFERE